MGVSLLLIYLFYIIMQFVIVTETHTIHTDRHKHSSAAEDRSLLADVDRVSKVNKSPHHTLRLTHLDACMHTSVSGMHMFTGKVLTHTHTHTYRISFPCLRRISM